VKSLQSAAHSPRQSVPRAKPIHAFVIFQDMEQLIGVDTQACGQSAMIHHSHPVPLYKSLIADDQWMAAQRFFQATDR
jgi:hypothetical protein